MPLDPLSSFGKAEVWDEGLYLARPGGAIVRCGVTAYQSIAFE